MFEQQYIIKKKKKKNFIKCVWLFVVSIAKEEIFAPSVCV